jgi:hypothetical protein
MDAVSLSQNEVLEAIAAALQPLATVDDGLTVMQLVALTGSSRTTIIKHLRQMMDAGRLEVVFVQARRIDGMTCRLPAYRLK